MKRPKPPLTKSLLWCLALRCPACGRSQIFARLFHLKESCEACGVIFKREEGFFVGAIMVAVVTTELIIVLAYLFSLPVISEHYQLVIGVLLGLALVFPLAFYHHSWSIWLSFDHFVEGLPRQTSESRAPRPQ